MKQSSMTAALIALLLSNNAAWTEEGADRTNRSNNGIKANLAAPGEQPEAANGVDRNAAAQKDESDNRLERDGDAIRDTANTYLTAFSKGDAKAIAAHFTEDAEYVDYATRVVRGRAAIEEIYKNFFDDNPSASMKLRIDSIKFLSPTVAIEDGIISLQKSQDSEPIGMPYTAIHLKENEKWLVASVREGHESRPHQHQAQLQKLKWLIGDWIHEGADSLVHFECRPSIEGNYLIRNFNLQAAGRRKVTGIQMIGWDAQSQRLRSWIFDSEGGFAEGYWRHNQDEWFLDLAGVTADGRSASSTSVYTPIDDRTIQFRTINHQVGGMSLPDSDLATIVRRPVRPGDEQQGTLDGSSSRSQRLSK